MKQLIKDLNNMIPTPVCELNYESNFQLLIAVMLSAQCTDKRVNAVTQTLFKKYKTPQDFANLTVETLGKDIYSLGFYHNKSKNIINASKDIIARFNGEVPSTMEELTTLAGVGRKTASVVLAEGFKEDAFAVDTHVFRVSNRLGIANAKNAQQSEIQLKEYFDKKDWSKVHLQLVNLGRYVCVARSPKCEECKLQKHCKYFKENKGE